MESIYDILSAEHRQVADLLQQAMRDNSKETSFKVKAKTDIICWEKRNFSILNFSRKKSYVIL